MCPTLNDPLPTTPEGCLAEIAVLTGMSKQDILDFMNQPLEQQLIEVQGYKSQSWAQPSNTSTLDRVIAVMNVLGTFLSFASGAAGAATALAGLKTAFKSNLVLSSIEIKPTPDGIDVPSMMYKNGFDAGYAKAMADMKEAIKKDLGPKSIPEPVTTAVVRTPPLPVDRSARTTLHGMDPDGPEHRELEPSGMQKDYVILSDAERAKGFVRPVRQKYRHLTCGTVTTMGLKLSETYARDPGFYSGTFCAGCHEHYPVGENGEFVWDGTTEKVGT